MIHNGAIETDRLRIRPMRSADAPFLVELFADPEVRRFVDGGAPLDAATAELWVRRSNANLERFGYGTGVVVERSSGKLIGWAGFARPEGQPEEIIYGLAASCWGGGYGTEILAALIDFAERRLRARSIRATVHPENVISVRLLTRHGFLLEERAFAGVEDTDLYVRATPC